MTPRFPGKPFAFWILAALLLLGAACNRLPAPARQNPTAPASQAPATLLPAVVPGPAAETSPQPDESAPQSPQAADAVPALTQPANTPAAAASDPDSYSLTLQLDYYRRHAQVSETIHYRNATGKSLSELSLVVDANRFPGAFALRSLAVGSQAPSQGYALMGHRMVIPLDEPLEPGQWLDLHLEYDLFFPKMIQEAGETRPYPFGASARQTNLVDWYPYLPPYQPESGWLVHDAWPFGEHLVYPTADFSVTVTLAGLPAPEGAEILIAASAPAERVEAELQAESYHYSLSAGRSFAISVSDSYRVFTTTVGEVTVYSYAFPFTLDGGQAALLHTAQALELYSELFGPYPHPSLTVVEADFLDGMEYDGLYFLSHGFYNTFDGTPKNYLTAIAVHETGHQWWYGQVGNDQALQPWLDEALCTYLERLYYERYFPELVDWWWAFRVDYYQPAGAIDLSIYDYQGFLPYRNAVYLRGAQFMEVLRDLMGDAAFFEFLAAYARQYTDRLATTSDFFALLNDYAPPGWEASLEGWFANPIEIQE